jgi:hypothetical protein
LIQAFSVTSPLFNSYLSAIKTVALLTNTIQTTFKDVLTPAQANTLFRLDHSLICELTDRTQEMHTRYEQMRSSKEGPSSKSATQCCNMCGENIHENNIKHARIALEENKNEQFQLVLEQIRKAIEEPLFTEKEID